MSPTLFIDADACPVTNEALACARRNHLPVVIAGNSTQNLEKHIRRGDRRVPMDDSKPKEGFWVSTLVASVGSDSADFAIIERLDPGDIVITQDIGLAAMVLGRDAAAIGVRGHIYHRATIDSELERRHIEKKVRRQGGRTKGPSALTDEDREYFADNLERLVVDALRI